MLFAPLPVPCLQLILCARVVRMAGTYSSRLFERFSVQTVDSAGSAPAPDAAEAPAAKKRAGAPPPPPLPVSATTTASVQEAEGRIGGQALYAFVFPNFMINRYGPWMDTNVALPVSRTETAVVFDCAFQSAVGCAIPHVVTDGCSCRLP